MRILWIAFVWPEPASSAAGGRTLRLLETCRSAGHTVHVVSPCQENQHQKALEEHGIRTDRLLPNDPAFDEFLAAYQPDLVFFDRFMIEEQFSWRVRAGAPDAVRILDTIDLHSLRRLREEKVKRGEDPLRIGDDELHSDDALRELASIYRSDLSLIISDAEIQLLTQRYNVNNELLHLCGFFYEIPEHFYEFETRQHLVFIGNAHHAPNRDAVRMLKNGVWREIRRALMQRGIPQPELHIYGAYPPKEWLDFHNPREGFYVLGQAGDAGLTLSKYRVNLAPLRFGAGLKGKIADGWAVGTPCAATQVAAEGMTVRELFGGCIEDEPSRYAERVAELYTSEGAWRSAQENGVKILRTLFDRHTQGAAFIERLDGARRNLGSIRQKNHIGAVVWHQSLRSTEYFSRWIEGKGIQSQQRRLPINNIDRE